MSNVFARLQPYNQKTGALCSRYTIGGRTFAAGEWYSIPESVAAPLRELEQDSGAPVFQMFTEEQFRTVAQSELAAAMQAAGLQGLAINAPLELPKVKTPKTGAVKGKFDGLDKKIGEVDLASPASVAQAAVVKDDSDQADVAPATLSDMDEAALLDVAEDMNLDYEPEANAEDLRSLIAAKMAESEAE